MGLHIGVRVSRSSAPAASSCASRRGHGEARRHRIVEPAALAPARDQRLALVVAALRVVREAGGRVAVHHHLAGDHPRAAPRPPRRTRRRIRDGQCNRPPRSSCPGGTVRRERTAPPRSLWAGSANFCSSTNVYFLQPFEQLRAIGGDDPGLRIMDMRVDEAGQHQPAGMVVDRAPGGARARMSRASPTAAMRPRRSPPRRPRSAPRAGAGEPRIVAEAENAAANDPLRHARISAMRRAAILSISASAVLNSLAGSALRRASNAATTSSLLLPLTARMKGKPKRSR